MPVNTPHEDYTEAAPDWELVRDCIEGSTTVKAAGAKYLPKLYKQPDDEYKAYVTRALFFNATARVVEAAVGLLFRKPPTIDLPDNLQAILADADLSSSPFLSYARRVLADVVAVGRCGTLVDYSTTEKRPYCAFYEAEAILNWRESRRDGKMILDMLVLAEEYEEPNAADEFAPKCGPQWRVLRNIEGVGVTFEVWRVSNSDSEKGFYLTTPPTLMQRRGQSLAAIPFVFHNAETPGSDVGRVPMADLAHVNVSHYRTSADLENGRHMAGIPTPVAVGFPAKGEFYLGSTHVWVSEDPTAKATFLEFTGQGLTALSGALEEKAQQMAALGARLIEPKTKDAEAYETVIIRATSEASTLARIGILSTEGLTEVLAWCAYWLGTAPTMEESATGLVFTLNKDFVSASMTPQLLTALANARGQGLISAETFFYNLQRGELIAEDETFEQELQRIADNPGLPTPAGGAPPAA